jgi:flagellar assembly protein FliH
LLIKRQQANRLRQPKPPAPSGGASAPLGSLNLADLHLNDPLNAELHAGLPELSATMHVSPEEEAWSLEAMAMGAAQERRNDDRRRTYRRVEDKDLISRAHEEANAIRENARDEGFEEGLRRAEEMMAEMRETFASLMNVREEALLSASDEIAKIAIEVAERIIRTEVTCDPSLIQALVRDTIQKSGRGVKNLLVKVHPDSEESLKQALKDEPVPNLKAELIIMDDPTLEPGSCIVETNSGLIDASFTTQLEMLKRLLGLGA